jgi:hypothetical protein
MPGRIELPLLPEEAVTLSPRLAVIETPGELVFVNASGALMSCSRNDATAKRYIGAVLMTLGLTKGEDLAAVLGVHRSTLFRNQTPRGTPARQNAAPQARGARGPTTGGEARRSVDRAVVARRTRRAGRPVGRRRIASGSRFRNSRFAIVPAVHPLTSEGRLLAVLGHPRSQRPRSAFSAKQTFATTDLLSASGRKRT